MATNHDIEAAVSRSNTFCAAPTIRFDPSIPIGEITQEIIEHGESGLPYVITGFSLDEDNEQSSFRQRAEWIESIYTNRARGDLSTDAHRSGGAHNATVPILPCPPEWITWLQDSFMVPNCLVLHGGNDILPEEVQSISLRPFGPETETPFQEDSCATFIHDLCVGGTDARKYWFMTAAEDWRQVAEHLRARDGSQTIPAQSMSLQELSELPFNVYFHIQEKGDLVILPPRSFSQKIHRSVTVSLCWERMTLRGLEVFIYHDRIFKHRICAQTRYRPHQLLCNTVLKLRNELVNLKQSQPNDSVLLSAKSGTLEQGFRLLDEVIASTHCERDDELPTIEFTLSPPPCTFCGGELFRAVFCCTDSCVRDDATSDSTDDKIVICDLCFVDGRACKCGSMAPYWLQPLAGLVELRTNIANLLGLDEGSGVSSSSQNSQECSVFGAARTLCEIKGESAQSTERSCSLQRAPSHRVPKFSIINCLRCHANRCYKHILSTYHIHSAQALKAHLMDTTSDLWHKLHIETKANYARYFPRLRVAIESQSRYPLVHRLSYYASAFAPAAPLNQAVTLGFYDNMDAEMDTQGQAASLRRSMSRTASIASITGVEEGVHQRQRRRGSSTQASSVVEGSNPRKRRQSPPEEGIVTRKRARVSEAINLLTTETIQEETRIPRELGGGTVDEENEPSLNAGGSGQGGASHATPSSRPLVREFHKPNRRSHQGDQLSSPLHHPLEFFDPDADLALGEPGSPKSEFHSTWEELLGAHTTCVSQPDSEPAPTTEQAAVQVLAPTTAVQLASLPSSSSLRYPDAQPARTSGTSHSRGVHPSARPVSSSAWSAQGGSMRRHRARSTTPGPHQGQNTSHSVDFTTSEFSFRVPSRISHAAPRVSRNHHNLHPVSTGYPPDSRGSVAFTQSHAQTSDQRDVAPPRPRRSIIGNYLSSENISAYAEILQQSKKEWEDANNRHGFRKDRV